MQDHPIITIIIIFIFIIIIKGARVVTTLLPHGPEKPRGGIVKTLSTREVEITWEPPKGGFTKYLLSLDPNVSSTNPPDFGNQDLQQGVMGSR